jgi:hypothetical protein
MQSAAATASRGKATSRNYLIVPAPVSHLDALLHPRDALN